MKRVINLAISLFIVTFVLFSCKLGTDPTGQNKEGTVTVTGTVLEDKCKAKEGKTTTGSTGNGKKVPATKHVANPKSLTDDELISEVLRRCGKSGAKKDFAVRVLTEVSGKMS